MNSLAVLSDARNSAECRDRVLLDLWHPIGALSQLPSHGEWHDQLLGVPLRIERTAGGAFRATRKDRPDEELPVQERFSYLWTSLGEPRDLFDIPEAHEADRRLLHAGSIMVHTSAGRGMENFLDMGHFPFVHPGVLGDEPRTEVKDYTVTSSVADHEIWATECVFYQPQAAMDSTEGAEVDYAYRVMHPNCAALFKSNAKQPERFDTVALFIQPLDEEHIRAHMWLCLLDDDSPDWALRRFQVDIFGHDKPILENQLPRRLPLDPRAETPIRADKTGVSYRRMLSQLGVRYGVIPGAV
ncbi:aromatic ring-hydroxylating oxygenase subunit alpha [Ruania zhangjianzhongii]|uniref:aromatic ring-hydroxylating oxygenase subunit alpha n=1 Tax=Ruania zhangjianzhongii TaxID=2603206 RepID=UPI0011CAF659|nr:aromatic ring-hydroxylating dioxygenase subunit alpha [Ruania zhangjianzhongii]